MAKLDYYPKKKANESEVKEFFLTVLYIVLFGGVWKNNKNGGLKTREKIHVFCAAAKKVCF